MMLGLARDVGSRDPLVSAHTQLGVLDHARVLRLCKKDLKLQSHHWEKQNRARNELTIDSQFGALRL